MSDAEYLIELAKELDNAHRFGARTDEPEGAREIHISDTLARQVAERLRAIAERVTDA
jgi:hypothetical protein